MLSVLTEVFYNLFIAPGSLCLPYSVVGQGGRDYSVYFVHCIRDLGSHQTVSCGDVSGVTCSIFLMISVDCFLNSLM